MHLFSYQVLKLDVQVFTDGEFGVRNGFVQIRVQIMQHLRKTMTFISLTDSLYYTVTLISITVNRSDLLSYGFDGLQQLDAELLHVSMSFSKLHEGFAGGGLRLAHTDDGKHVAKR